MFGLAILIGIYSYLIFCLGVVGQLYTRNIFIITVLFLAFSFYYHRKDIFSFLRKEHTPIKLDNLSKTLLVLIVAALIVNLVGALGPELGFDALWYHLTLPKIFLTEHRIFHITGGLFYYSDFPKLVEMYYISALSFSNEIAAKLIHFSFGLLALFALYKFSRKFLDIKYSLLAVVVLLGNLVFAWESTTSYVDLAWTFFEIMALWGFVEWYSSKERKWIIESGVMLGLAISTKLIAFSSVPIFIILFLLFQKDKKEAIKNSALFTIISIIVSSPWFIYSYLNTGNPFYPLFTNLYPTSLSAAFFNPINVFNDLFNVFLRAADPISPIYLIFIPLLVMVYKKFDKNLKIITVFSVLAILSWYFIPRTGGGRFILPYLPIFSLLAAGVLTSLKSVWIKKYAIGLCILICIITIAYRGLANSKFIPVVLGFQTKDQFLIKNLNFEYGDFYDTDHSFTDNLKPSDSLLLYGFHNLYYADFNFIDSSYVRKGDRFNYVAVQNADIPGRFSHWNLVYENPKTHVKLYNLGGITWHY